MSEDTYTPVTLVYVGARQTDNPARIHHEFQQVEDEGDGWVFACEDVSYFYSDKPAIRRRMAISVGVIIEVPMDEDMSVRSRDARVIDRWPDEDERTQWAAEHRIAKAASDAVKGARKADPFQEALDPVREAYRRARGTHRAQLLAAIVRYITS